MATSKELRWFTPTFQKSRYNRQILSDRMVRWCKFHTENWQILGAAIQNLVVTTTWPSALCIPPLTFIYWYCKSFRRNVPTEEHLGNWNSQTFMDSSLWNRFLESLEAVRYKRWATKYENGTSWVINFKFSGKELICSDVNKRVTQSY
jgi:hypothetical protein